MSEFINRQNIFNLEYGDLRGYLNGSLNTYINNNMLGDNLNFSNGVLSVVNGDNILKLVFTQSSMYDLGVNPLKVFDGEPGNALIVTDIRYDFSEMSPDYTISTQFGSVDAVLTLSYFGGTGSFGNSDRIAASKIKDGQQDIRSNIRENADVYIVPTSANLTGVIDQGSGTVSMYITYKRIDV